MGEAEGCVVCLPGPQGLLGLNGRSSLPAIIGESEMPGEAGNRGFGSVGNSRQPGLSGIQGIPGKPGEPAQRGAGLPGPIRQMGPPGPPGEP
uniref:Collagen alpha-1(I) chain-like n=1 Tax=Angiostrongylus cantonensis TaxID=6313 RepID=A0A0K0DMJ9_ANGCA